MLLSEKKVQSQRVTDDPLHSRPQGRRDVGSGLRRIRSSISDSSDDGPALGKRRVYITQDQASNTNGVRRNRGHGNYRATPDNKARIEGISSANHRVLDRESGNESGQIVRRRRPIEAVTAEEVSRVTGNDNVPFESEEPTRGEHILDEATITHRISTLRQLNGATQSRHRHANSTGARNRTFNQPVVVRTVPPKIVDQTHIENIGETETYRTLQCANCSFLNHSSLPSCEMCGSSLILQHWPSGLNKPEVKFVPHPRSPIPSTHSFGSPSLPGGGSDEDSDVDSNTIPESKPIISYTISKDNTQGEYARNSKLLADFGRKIRLRGCGNCFGEAMISVEVHNLPDKSPLLTPREYFFKALEIQMNEVRRQWQAVIDITFTHSSHTRSKSGESEWPDIHHRSLHHTPNLGKLSVARSGMTGLERGQSKENNKKRAQETSIPKPNPYKVLGLSKDAKWSDVESMFRKQVLDISWKEGTLPVDIQQREELQDACETILGRFYLQEPEPWKMGESFAERLLREACGILAKARMV